MTPKQLWGLAILICVSYLIFEATKPRDIEDPVLVQQTKWDFMIQALIYLAVVAGIILLCDPWRF